MAETSDILRANLTALARTEPELARRLRDAAPAAMTWTPSKAGPLTATLDVSPRPIALASRYDPLGEAEKLNQPVDLRKHACIVMLGMGVGYHLAQMAEQLSDNTLMIVYEPDLQALRAVLERVDHSQWIGRYNVILADGVVDRGAFISRIEKFGGIVTQGLVMVTHPVARRLHGESLSTFSAMVSDALAYCRTNVATALVNASRTVRNLCLNLPLYAGGATTNDLYQAARDCPAVCVSAGPSLAKNVALLSDPDVRRNVVVITAQTTLKPLLDRGIRPDFVTALDYHEISRRFYEGLEALDDVTLVCECKVNPVVPAAFPGPIRVAQNRFLDKLLGGLARPIVPVRPGATVAHLSFYLAQHLGCDPIIFIGQDLAFSDGLYYCPGTAIHDVWEPELNPFNTLEMMEWTRIVRHRGNLHKMQDIHGQDVYSDEQMVTYLKQFERDFAEAPQQVIDATEGGVAKEHSTRMTLVDAIAKHATRPIPKLPLAPRKLDVSRLHDVRKLVRSRLEDIIELRRLARETIPLLQKMKRQQKDKAASDRLYNEIERNKKRVEQRKETFLLINELNTVGAFRRARADRAIEHTNIEDLDAFERQAMQLDRDVDNLDWMIQACDEAVEIFQLSDGRLTDALGEAKHPAMSG